MIKRLFKNIYESIWYTATFLLLLLTYLTSAILRFLGKFIPGVLRRKIGGQLNRIYVRILKFNRQGKNTINRVNLIELSIRNMGFKKSRSIITIGGMAVGIGAIVFLVSLGYGLQELVISRVAKLNEMKQINIVPQTGSRIRINDGSLSGFQEISGVDRVFPIIAAVGRVNFQDSVSDMVVYGVTADYLNQSAIQPVHGKIFDSNEIVTSFLNLEDRVEYAVETYNMISDGDNNEGEILGTEDENGESSGESADGMIDWVDIDSEAVLEQASKAKTVAMDPSAKREAVVNRATLSVLGIKEEDAIGQKFNSSFVITSDLLSDGEDKIESELAEYVIVGVIPGDKTPIFYVPFIDLRSLGVVNYSQATVVVENEKELDKARKKIEAMGFATSSVVDTINQINSLFATIRTILALLGAVALAVAALGMFNTLTVSLLERTREVGLMKAMGMKSSEVKELFLTESMTMVFFGGILGIIIGFLGGKALSLILSAFAVFKGAGFIDVTHIPMVFISLILFLSLFVGIGTGIYPAKRATKISALDALRYE